VRDRHHPPPTQCPNGPEWGLATEDLLIVPYELKPGEAERATAAVHNRRWGPFLVHTTRFGLRFALDRAVLGLLRLVMAGPRLVLRLAPALREPWNAYRDAVRGHPLSTWPGRAREVWGRRRACTAREGKRGA
jgi:hypothetical protein